MDDRHWKHFDLVHQEDFSNDPRNIMFGLIIDEMNPFREMKNPHSTWTVIMYIFNLPHDCATNESIFYLQPSYPILNKLSLTQIFFRTIDGGHA
jgi:hypothetical protein